MGAAIAQMKKGRFDEAMATLDRATSVGRAVQTIQWNAHRAFVLSAAGRAVEAAPIFAEIEAAAMPRPPRTIIGAAYACAGQMDRAFEWLDRAFRELDSRIVFANVDPALDCARADPRLRSLMVRMHLGPH
jgi:hypothetical protein